MLGRGVKRKRSCSEEPEEAGTVEVEGNDGVLLAQGKSDMTPLQQRQLVLSLCLDKLQGYQAGMELGLRRSVLLINMLRQIQEDMKMEGAGTGTGSLDLSVQRRSTHPGTLVCSPDVSNSLLDLPRGGVDPDSYLLRDNNRDDMPLTCPGCAEGEKEGLSLLSPPHPSLPGSPSSDRTSLASSKSQTPTTHHPSSDTANATGYLSDLAPDDVFEDIDTSMCDTSDLPSTWAVGSYWPVSLSLWGDEELKMCATGHASHAGTCQSCLTDLNDLDHIMEILVNS